MQLGTFLFLIFQCAPVPKSTVMAPKAPPTLESLDAKLNTLLKKMDEFSAVRAEVEEMRVAVGTLMETVASQGREITALKEQANSRDQQLRSSSVRLYGFGHAAEDDGDPKALAKRVYDSVVKPVLVAAKAGKLIDVLPQLSNTISEAYRIRVFSSQEPIPGQPPPPPAPIIIKFTNQATRLAFLRCKREHIPAPLEADKAIGTKKYSASEDLTSPTHKMFKAMIDSNLVDKVWTVDGRLRFTVPGDKTVRRVKSVFSSVADVIRSG